MKKIIINGYELSEEQLLPIMKSKETTFIIAGAGSGKTLTILGKIKNLLENNIKPNEILCISFTNETVNNLKKNIIKNCNTSIPVYTFHKLAIEILEAHLIEFEIAPPNILEETITEFFEKEGFKNKVIKNIFWNMFSFTLFKTPKNWQKILLQENIKKEKKTILSFINYMFSNNLEKEDIITLLKKKRLKNHLILIYAIITYYETKKERNNYLDFHDLIKKATNILKEKGCPFPIKEIIIDEFQDSSYSRLLLIKEIKERTKANLMVVGDDFQSIYGFSGCDLNLFLNFKKYFPNTTTYHLNETYRNSQELIDIAGTFIKKNPYQIKKNLKSLKKRKQPIKIVYFKEKETILEKVLSNIKENEKILILGRNNFDIKNYTKKLPYQLKSNNQIEFQKFKNHQITYLTIHKSKGLESDIVILLNVEDSINGIPTQLKNKKLMNLITKKESYPFEEERRLFYVALTRTKKDIYLLTPITKPSSFIKEIKKDKNVEKIYYF